MLSSCIGSTWSAMVWQCVKCCRYCSMWLQDLWQMPDDDSHQFSACSDMNRQWLAEKDCLVHVGFFIHSPLHFRSSPLILNPLHLNYSYSMNKSILKQHLEKVCPCVCILFERKPPFYLLAPFSYHLKKKVKEIMKIRKGKRQYPLSTLQMEKCFNISEKFD